jgi:hypothetical protein
MKSSSHLFRKAIWAIVISSFLFLNTSCVTDGTKLTETYIKKSEAQQQIEALKKKHAEELEKITSDISKSKDVIILGQDAQLQTIADSLYGANLAFTFYTPPEPSRVDLIVNNRVNEAAAATGKKATAEAMEKENERLKKELDEKITSLEDLRKKHAEVMKTNTELANQTESDKKELTRLQKEMSDMALRHSTELSDKQTEVIFLQDEINKLEKDRADDREARQKMERDAKMKAMAVCGILSLLCVAGAIWMPAFKSKFVAGAATFGGCAAVIMYIQPWMVAAGVGVVVLGIIVKMTMEHHAVDKTATNLVSFVEDQKKTNPTAFDKETLKNYNGKYVVDSDTGKTTVVADPDVEKVIEQKLRESQRI